MKLLIGLGNPDKKYRDNRHNVGHMFVDWAKRDSSSKRTVLSEELFFLKTDCFMNESGKCVRRELRKLGIKDYSQLYIVHDDLDIPLGQYKVQLGVGPKVHNGILSIERELGIKEFWRVRIGVDDRPKIQDSGFRIQGEKYVLENFTVKEKEILENLFPKILSELEDR